MTLEKTVNWSLGVVGFVFIIFVCSQIFSNERLPDFDPWTQGKPLKPNLSVLPYHGLDVSQEQGYIDWQATTMDRLIEFVYVKATEGTNYVDPRYLANVSAAHDYGFLIGSYHTLTAKGSVVEQFFNFNKHVLLSAQRLLPMIEVDEVSTSGWTPQQVCDSLALFAWLVKDYYGCQPMIRTHQQFFEKTLRKRFGDFPLFVVRERKIQPRVKGARRFLLWQRSTHGNVPGIYYDVNLDSYTQGTSLEDLMISNY